MTQRNRQKEATRIRLLGHALRLCARRGFAAVRTLDVARAAGLSHGAVFVHFPTREDLLSEVLRAFAATLTGAVHAQISAPTGLRAALDAHLAVLARHETLYRYLLLEGPSLGRPFRASWTGIQSAVATHLAAAAAREPRLKTMPPHLFFNTWIGLVHHYVIHRDLFAPGRSALALHGPALAAHFLDLVTERTPS